MIDKKMEEALVKQVNAELYSGYLYLSMSSWFASKNLMGFSHWMKAQAKEEQKHAMKLFDYVIERGGRVTLAKIDEPKNEWLSPLNVFEEVYSHERKVTEMIHALKDTAIALKDYAADVFLNWFVSEQVEEEASADEVLQKLKMIGDAPNGLLFMDHELGERD